MNARSKNNKLLIKSIPWTIADGLFSFVYAIGMVVMLGYFLSAKEFGLAGIAIAVTQLVEATYASGIQEGVVRATSGHTRLSDTGHTLAVGFAILGALLCSALAWPLSIIYGQSEIVYLVIAASFALILNAFFLVPTAKLS